MEKDILQVKNFKKFFQTAQGTLKAVDGINFNVEEGEMFALVGESGSGKSTTGFAIAGAKVYTPTDGKILFRGKDITLPARQRKEELQTEITMVFQDPGASLNPTHSVKGIIGMPLKLHKSYESKKELESEVADLLRSVKLPPEEYMNRVPPELGGGESQLVAIARALAPDPSFVVFDEPTSALDVSIQAKVLRVILNAQEEKNLSSLFITHNLGVVRNVSDRVAIMYLGTLFEIGLTPEIFESPRHPYTRMLLSSIPVITKEEERMQPKKIHSTGEIPSPVNPPSGCRFHPRCPFSTEICEKQSPQLSNGEHQVACHHWKELE